MIDKLKCKFCGNGEVRKVGIQYSPNGNKQKWQCKSCYRIFNTGMIEEKQKDV